MKREGESSMARKSSPYSVDIMALSITERMVLSDNYTSLSFHERLKDTDGN